MRNTEHRDVIVTGFGETVFRKASRAERRKRKLEKRTRRKERS